MSSLELVALTLDAHDPARLAAFWSALLERPSAPDGLLPGSATQVGLRFVPGSTPRTGPGRVHLHLGTSAETPQDATVERALALGASPLDVEQLPEERHVVLAIFGGRLRQHPELVRAWHLRPPTDRRAWLFRLAGTAGWTSLPWLHHVTQPTLVLHGDDDPIVPAVNARLIAWRLPRAQLEVVEGGGHLLLLDSAADVVPLITEFLTRTPTDPPAHERGRLQ